MSRALEGIYWSVNNRSPDRVLLDFIDSLPPTIRHDLLDAIATHRVAGRPDRYEPRVKKRRRNHFCWLNQPRSEVRRKMARGVLKI